MTTLWSSDGPHFRSIALASTWESERIQMCVMEFIFMFKYILHISCFGLYLFIEYVCSEAWDMCIDKIIFPINAFGAEPGYAVRLFGSILDS